MFLEISHFSQNFSLFSKFLKNFTVFLKFLKGLHMEKKSGEPLG